MSNEKKQNKKNERNENVDTLDKIDAFLQCREYFEEQIKKQKSKQNLRLFSVEIKHEATTSRAEKYFA